MAFNCQSLYAYDSIDTIEAVEQLSSKYEFTILSETRETMERKATLDHRLLRQHEYFSTYIDQFKGGVGILVKKEFMKKFPNTDLKTCWKIIVPGRVGRLELLGPQGSLQIFAIYFDPSSQSLQKSHIEAIDKVIDNRFHVILAGDFNFVEHQTDRFVKQTESWSFGADKTVNTRWQSFLSRHAIKEWAQPHFTCETGIVLSRIDRIYSNLHLAHRLLDVSYAVVLDRDPSISCHRPLSFGIRSGKAARPNVFPDWIVQHPEFLKEVEAEYLYRLGDGATSGFERLAILKTALVESAKLLRKIATHERPTSTDDRIGLCVAFLRAVQLGSFKLAGSLQRKYPEELGDVDLTTNFWHSQTFARVQDHLFGISADLDTSSNQRAPVNQGFFAREFVFAKKIQHSAHAEETNPGWLWPAAGSQGRFDGASNH